MRHSRLLGLTAAAPALGALRLVGRARTGRVARVATTLSEGGTVGVTVDRLLPGRRQGRVCRAGRLTGTRCLVVRRTGSVRLTSAAGAAVLRMPARFGRTALVPGTYRLTAVATDAAGNRSAARRLTITVAR